MVQVIPSDCFQPGEGTHPGEIVPMGTELSTQMVPQNVTFNGDAGEFGIFANCFCTFLILGPEPNAQSWLLWTFVSSVTGIGFTGAVLLIGHTVDTHLPTGWAKTPLALATFVVLNHFVYTLLYLGTVYDSAETFKPYWTNWLG
jgi:hypothetical protein